MFAAITCNLLPDIITQSKSKTQTQEVCTVSLILLLLNIMGQDNSLLMGIEQLQEQVSDVKLFEPIFTRSIPIV